MKSETAPWILCCTNTTTKFLSFFIPKLSSSGSSRTTTTRDVLRCVVVGIFKRSSSNNTTTTLARRATHCLLPTTSQWVKQGKRLHKIYYKNCIAYYYGYCPLLSPASIATCMLCTNCQQQTVMRTFNFIFIHNLHTLHCGKILLSG